MQVKLKNVNKRTHNPGPLVVFAVLLQNETVGGEGCHGVEEGEDGDGYEELG